MKPQRNSLQETSFKPKGLQNQHFFFKFSCLFVVAFSNITYSQNKNTDTNNYMTYQIKAPLNSNKDNSKNHTRRGSALDTIGFGFGEPVIWDFGENAEPQKATGRGPFKINYTKGGVKKVKMITYNPILKDSIVKINYISVNLNKQNTSYRFRIKDSRP